MVDAFAAAAAAARGRRGGVRQEEDADDDGDNKEVRRGDVTTTLGRRWGKYCIVRTHVATRGDLNSIVLFVWCACWNKKARYCKLTVGHPQGNDSTYDDDDDDDGSSSYCIRPLQRPWSFWHLRLWDILTTGRPPFMSVFGFVQRRLTVRALSTLTVNTTYCTYPHIPCSRVVSKKKRREDRFPFVNDYLGRQCAGMVWFHILYYDLQLPSLHSYFIQASFSFLRQTKRTGSFTTRSRNRSTSPTLSPEC